MSAIEKMTRFQVVDVLPAPKPNPADYLVEFDDAVSIDGFEVDVKVLYPDDHDDMEVYTLDENLDAGELITGRLSRADRDRLFGYADDALIEVKVKKALAAYDRAEDWKRRERSERGAYEAFSHWWK